MIIKALKRIIFLCGTVVLSIGICSCALFEDGLKEQKAEVNDVAHLIVNLLESGDKKQFKELFTDEAINTDDFNAGLEYTFKIYSGKLQSMDGTSGHIRDHYDEVKHTKTAYPYFKIVTTENVYRLDFDYYLRYKIDFRASNNEGKIFKFKLSIIDEANITDSDYYYNYKSFDRCGIYNPDWDAAVSGHIA